MKTLRRVPDGMYFFKGSLPYRTNDNWGGIDWLFLELGRSEEAQLVKRAALRALPRVPPDQRDMFIAFMMEQMLRAAGIRLCTPDTLPPLERGFRPMSRAECRARRLQHQREGLVN